MTYLAWKISEKWDLTPKKSLNSDKMDHAELENLVGEYLLVNEDEAENLLRDSPRRRLRLLSERLRSVNGSADRTIGTVLNRIKRYLIRKSFF